MQWFVAALTFASLVNLDTRAMAARGPRASRCHADAFASSVFAHGTPIEPKSEVRVEKIFVTRGARVNRGDRIARLRGRGTFEVVAPFTGTVVDTCVVAGERSGPGRPLIRLAPPNQPLANQNDPVQPMKAPPTVGLTSTEGA
jgi:biotin carboxyl carrier protein